MRNIKHNHNKVAIFDEEVNFLQLTGVAVLVLGESGPVDFIDGDAIVFI